MLFKNVLWALLTAQKTLSPLICCLVNNNEFLFNKKIHGKVDGWVKKKKEKKITLKISTVFNCQESSTCTRLLVQQILEILECPVYISNKIPTDFSESRIPSRGFFLHRNNMNMKNTWHFFPIVSTKFRRVITQWGPFYNLKAISMYIYATEKKQ